MKAYVCEFFLISPSNRPAFKKLFRDSEGLLFALQITN